MSDFRGYDPDIERLDLLQAESQSYAPQCRAGEGLDEFDPSDWLNIENQRSWPSCGGHALSSLMEVLYWLKTGDEIQLSRMFAWVESQRQHGRPSQRDGISIWSAVEVAKEIGLPLEELAPYKVGDWYDDFDESVYLDAKTRIAANSYELKSYDDVIDFHRSGMGGTIWGCEWLFQRNAWHAVAGCGHTREGSVRIANSHGLNSGDQGWHLWDERTVNKHFRNSGTICYGLSDLSTPQVRRFPWEKEFFV